jgi:hypothetical protein
MAVFARAPGLIVSDNPILQDPQRRTATRRLWMQYAVTLTFSCSHAGSAVLSHQRATKRHVPVQNSDVVPHLQVKSASNHACVSSYHTYEPKLATARVERTFGSGYQGILSAFCVSVAVRSAAWSAVRVSVATKAALTAASPITTRSARTTCVIVAPLQRDI